MANEKSDNQIEKLMDAPLEFVKDGNQFLNKCKTVSYTHLDVYKRQSQDRALTSYKKSKVMPSKTR